MNRIRQICTAPSILQAINGSITSGYKSLFFKRCIASVTSTNDSSLSSVNPVIDGSKSTSNEQPIIDALGRAYGTGRRKTSVARVWVSEGSGIFTVNDQRFIDYFQPVQREHALGSFLVSNTAGMFDVSCTVKGGGISGR